MEAGDYLLTQEKAGTRYVWVVARTFANMDDPEDLKKAQPSARRYTQIAYGLKENATAITL